MFQKIRTLIENKKRSGSFSGEINWCVNIHIRKAKHIHFPKDGGKPKFFCKLRIEKEAEPTRELLLEDEKNEFGNDQLTKVKYTHKTINPEKNGNPQWDVHKEFHCFKPKALWIQIVRAGDNSNKLQGVIVAQARMELDDYRGKAFKNLWIPLENKVPCTKLEHKDPLIQLCLGMAPRSCYGMEYFSPQQTDQVRARTISEPISPTVSIPLTLVEPDSDDEKRRALTS